MCKIRILSTVKKIPGGLMVIPLLLGATINTCAPKILNIGGLTTATFSSKGASTIIGITLVCIGSQLDFKNTRSSIKRGVTLISTKIILGYLLSVLIGTFLGVKGIFGVSTLAIVSVVTSGNGGLYVALMNQYGEVEDVGAECIMCIKDGPFLTLLILGATGIASIPIGALISSIGPMILGIILGNLDGEIRKLLANGPTILIPFFAFCLGASINLTDIINSGVGGIILSIIVISCGSVLFIADRYINKRPGYAGVAVGTASGISTLTPAAVALIDPSFQPYVVSATTQIATTVIFSAIVTPVITAIVAGRVYKKI